MYCSSCGAQIQSELNYCNRCGNRVPRNDVEMSSVASNLSQSISYTGGFGMLGFIFVILILVKNGVDKGALIPISFFYFAALFGICFLVIRQISAFSKKDTSTIKPEISVAEPTYLGPVSTAQLEARGEPPISVTEHTTRTLDEVGVERR